MAGNFKSFPLSKAAEHGCLSMGKFLLNNGAKIEDNIVFEATHLYVIIYLLRSGIKSTATDANGDTLTHKECKSGNLRNVKHLFQHYQADVTARNSKGQTPLHVACETVYPLKMVRFLIEEQHADPSVTCHEGKTALHYAAGNNLGLTTVRYLIKSQKQDPEVTDNEGKTAFLLACHFGSLTNVKIINYLIERKANIEARDKKGQTAIHYCLEHYRKEKGNKLPFIDFLAVALILAAKAKILKTRENQNTDPIFYWIKQSYASGGINSETDDAVAIVTLLFTACQGFRRKFDQKDVFAKHEHHPLLFIASHCNRKDIAKYIFNQEMCYIENHFYDEEANLRKKMLLESFLEFSCQEGWLELTKFLFQNTKSILENFRHLILDGSFLKTACKYKNSKVFKYLLEEEEAKDEATQFLNDFPLHYACKNGSLEIVQCLMKTKYIDVESKNKEGQTPLYCAICGKSTEIVKYLIKQKNASTNGIYEDGKNLLQVACKSGSLQQVKYICGKTKFDVNAQDANGSTALQLACRRWNIQLVGFLIDDMEANLHLVDNEGRTALHVACQWHFSEILIPWSLVTHGANVLAKDKNGKNPLQLAIATRNPAKEVVIFMTAKTYR